MLDGPVNAYTWTLGCAAMIVFAFKSWRLNSQTKNPLAVIYTAITVTLGIAFFFFGVPAFFTADGTILKYTYFLADLFVQISMQAMAWLLWFIGLRTAVQLRVLISLTAGFSAVLLILQLLTSQAWVDQSADLVVYADQMPVLVMKSAIYITIAWPIGYFLIREAFRQSAVRAVLKSLATGLIFILVSLAATINNIFDRGSDTRTSTVVVAVFFGLFLVVAALPRTKPAGSDRAE